MANITNEPIDSMAMDCDEAVDLHDLTANYTPHGHQPGHRRVQCRRKATKGKNKIPDRGVQKNKKQKSRRKTTNAPGSKRERKRQHAVIIPPSLFNGSEKIGEDNTYVDQDQPEQLQGLTGEAVLQALFDQTPGLIFPYHPTPGSFSSEVITDLVKALEDYQTTLTRQRTAIQSTDVAKLLKTFTHDVLCLLSRTKLRCRGGSRPDEDVLWDEMSYTFQLGGSRLWLMEAVLKRLNEVYRVGKADRLRSSPAFARAFRAPGSCPEIDVVISYARQQLGEPHYGHIATLQSLVGHFEAARTRYLESINQSDKPMSYVQSDVHMVGLDNETEISQHPCPHLGRLATDSSDEENDGLGDSGADSDVEDNVQVKGELLLGKDRALIQALDLWISLSSRADGKDTINIDMFSSLNL